MDGVNNNSSKYRELYLWCSGVEFYCLLKYGLIFILIYSKYFGICFSMILYFIMYLLMHLAIFFEFKGLVKELLKTFLLFPQYYYLILIFY